MNTKERMKRELGDVFETIEWGDVCLLYDKTIPSKYATMAYVGQFTISDNGKYLFNETEYETIWDMRAAMEEYNKALPFSAEIYNPSLRKNVFVETAIHEYLTAIGLEKVDGGTRKSYRLKDKLTGDMCYLEISVSPDSTSGRIKLSSASVNTISWWRTAGFEGIESAIGSINSLLSSFLLPISSTALKTVSNMTAERNAQMFDTRFDFNSLKSIVTDAKEETIKRLEEELKALKGE